MTAELIDTSAALADLCRDLKNSDCIAVDTEFARESTYYPHIGLIQIADDNHTACIDPLAVDVSAMLAELFFDDRITKVFHACLQDLEVIELVLGGKPCPLFDTQIATALMHPDHQMSYARLVETENSFIAQFHTANQRSGAPPGPVIDVLAQETSGKDEPENTQVNLRYLRIHR